MYCMQAHHCSVSFHTTIKPPLTAPRWFGTLLRAFTFTRLVERQRRGTLQLLSAGLSSICWGRRSSFGCKYSQYKDSDFVTKGSSIQVFVMSGDVVSGKSVAMTWPRTVSLVSVLCQFPHVLVFHCSSSLPPCLCWLSTRGCRLTEMRDGARCSMSGVGPVASRCRRKQSVLIQAGDGFSLGSSPHRGGLSEGGPVRDAGPGAAEPPRPEHRHWSTDDRLVG